MNDESLCQACGKPNLCTMAQVKAKVEAKKSGDSVSDNKPKRCWCFELNLSEEQRQAACKAYPKKQCLCQSCASLFKQV